MLYSMLSNTYICVYMYMYFIIVCIYINMYIYYHRIRQENKYYVCKIYILKYIEFINVKYILSVTQLGKQYPHFAEWDKGDQRD